jgi:uncharacterized RDD family membrane protein YckC
MRKAIIAGLLLLATTAHAADHVWRIWCGHPPTARAAHDTSAECWNAATILNSVEGNWKADDTLNPDCTEPYCTAMG